MAWQKPRTEHKCGSLRVVWLVGDGAGLRCRSGSPTLDGLTHEERGALVWNAAAFPAGLAAGWGRHRPRPATAAKRELLRLAVERAE